MASLLNDCFGVLCDIYSIYRKGQLKGQHTFLKQRRNYHPSLLTGLHEADLTRGPQAHGGNGWVTYDAVFRCNQQGKDRAWDVLDPSLPTAYIVGRGTGLRMPCKHCNETDHLHEDCTLAFLAPPTKGAAQQEREVLPLLSPPLASSHGHSSQLLSSFIFTTAASSSLLG